VDAGDVLLRGAQVIVEVGENDRGLIEHAGSDVVEAFTYYGHRQKLRIIGRENILEPLNREDLRNVHGHRLRRDLQEADGVVGKRLGVRLPDRHRMCHQLAHRRLEVVVADRPARDAGRTGADPALVEDQDSLTPAKPAGPQFPGQMPGRRQSVDARADDDIPAALTGISGCRAA
jgi:hypothetical protein